MFLLFLLAIFLQRGVGFWLRRYLMPVRFGIDNSLGLCKPSIQPLLGCSCCQVYSFIICFIQITQVYKVQQLGPYVLWDDARTERRICKYNDTQSGWWFEPLWKILVNWDDDIPNIWENKIDGNQTTNQQWYTMTSPLAIVQYWPCWTLGITNIYLDDLEDLDVTPASRSRIFRFRWPVKPVKQTCWMERFQDFQPSSQPKSWNLEEILLTFQVKNHKKT